MPRINENHDCKRDGCEGEKFKGMKVECNTCDKIWFLDCLVEEDDMYELMKTIGLVTLTQNETNKTITLKTKWTEEKQNTYNAIIGNQTSIEYACITCNSINSTKKRIKMMEKEIGKLNEQLKIENDKCKELKEKNEELNNRIMNTNTMLQELRKENDELNEQNRNLNTKNVMSDSEEEEEENEGNEVNMKTMKMMIKKTITKAMKCETDKMLKLMNESVENEWKQTKNSTETMITIRIKTL